MTTKSNGIINNLEKKSLAIGSDHGGFALKEDLRKYLSEQGHQIHDCGTFNTDSVDYPKFAYLVANAIAEKEADIGIIVDGAGIGSAMVANKVKGVRAALCYDVSTAKNAREHNNANVLTLGAGQIGYELSKQIVATFVTHSCTIDRHIRRVKMIDELDQKDIPTYSLEKTDSQEIKENPFPEVSDEDWAKIAQRVGELISGQPEVESSHKTSDMVCVCGVCVERKPETLRQFKDFGVDRFGYHDATGCECVPEDIAKCIDHTILKPDASETDIKKLCAEAREFNFASVCVSPSYVSIAAGELTGSPVKVCTVVGFPSGAHLPEIKSLETRRAIRDGAEEIDMVINIGALKSGNYDLVYRDIKLVCEACEDGGAISKVIIEAAYLSDEEKIIVCELAQRARANYVKTSTGFGPHGATAEDVALMKGVVVEAGIGVKAAGGIRSYEDAKAMISAGATCLGARAGIKIMQDAKQITVSE
jgi:deoxyribose-phosphate aldolase